MARGGDDWEHGEWPPREHSKTTIGDPELNELARKAKLWDDHEYEIVQQICGFVRLVAGDDREKMRDILEQAAASLGHV